MIPADERNAAYEVEYLERRRDRLKDQIDKGPIVVKNSIRLELEDTLGKLQRARDVLAELTSGEES